MTNLILKHSQVLDEAIIPFSASERLSDISSGFLHPFKLNTQKITFLFIMSSNMSFYKVNVGLLALLKCALFVFDNTKPLITLKIVFV